MVTPTAQRRLVESPIDRSTDPFDPLDLASRLEATQTNQGTTLGELSRRRPTLVVFLRHTGCTFCRQALADLRLRRRFIQEQGTQLVLVHLGSEEQAAEFFPRYELGEVPRISDPQGALYRAFGLARGTWRQLLGWRVWWRGLIAALVERHGWGGLKGDGRQMPGVFLISQGRIVRGYRHATSADRPDYVALARCGECSDRSSAAGV